MVTPVKKPCDRAPPRKTGPSSAQSEFSAVDGPARNSCRTIASARKETRTTPPSQPLNLSVSRGEGRNTDRLRFSRSRLMTYPCLLYTSDAADDLTRVDLGGRRMIK